MRVGDGTPVVRCLSSTRCVLNSWRHGQRAEAHRSCGSLSQECGRVRSPPPIGSCAHARLIGNPTQSIPVGHPQPRGGYEIVSAWSSMVCGPWPRSGNTSDRPGPKMKPWLPELGSPSGTGTTAVPLSKRARSGSCRRAAARPPLRPRYVRGGAVSDMWMAGDEHKKPSLQTNST